MSETDIAGLVGRLHNQLYIPPYAYGDNEAACQFVAAMKEAASALEHLAGENARLQKELDAALSALRNSGKAVDLAYTENARLREAIKSYVDPITYEDILARAALGDTRIDRSRCGPQTEVAG